MQTKLKTIKNRVQSLSTFNFIFCCLNVFCGIMLLCFCARTSIHIGPVPITLQTLGILIVGLCYPPLQAVYTTTLYLTAGILGFPIFCGNNVGIAPIIGIRGGYLMGMMIGTWLMAYLRKRSKKTTPLNLIIYGLIGLSAIYIIGISWLTNFMDFSNAIKVGFLPFIIPEFYKILIVFFIIYPIKCGKIKNNPLN